MRRLFLAMMAAVVGLSLWGAAPAQAQTIDYYNIGRYFYYPHYYYPHNHWPSQGPRWPERPGEPYMKPPAYMTYPPFREPHWRYEWMEPQSYHRGFHFWLDQF